MFNFSINQKFISNKYAIYWALFVDCTRVHSFETNNILAMQALQYTLIIIRINFGLPPNLGLFFSHRTRRFLMIEEN